MVALAGGIAKMGIQPAVSALPAALPVAALPVALPVAGWGAECPPVTWAECQPMAQ